MRKSHDLFHAPGNLRLQSGSPTVPPILESVPCSGQKPSPTFGTQLQVSGPPRVRTARRCLLRLRRPEINFGVTPGVVSRMVTTTGWSPSNVTPPIVQRFRFHRKSFTKFSHSGRAENYPEREQLPQKPGFFTTQSVIRHIMISRARHPSFSRA